MGTMKRFEMKIMLSIFLLISYVANGHNEDQTCNVYDRRGLTEATPAAHAEKDHKDESCAADGRRGLHEAAPGAVPAGGATQPASAGAAAAAGAAGAAPGAPGAVPAAAAVFDLSKCPGAKGDGVTDVTQSLMKTWDDACKSPSTAKILIPKGDWLTGEVDFLGPCTATPPIIFEIQGNLKAKPDCASFPSGMWINFYQTSIKIMGGGTIDGNGCDAWKTKKEGGKPLPDSLCITQCNLSSAENINLINGKGFNMKIVQSDGFSVNNMNISCAWDSPNTDGIHIGQVKDVSIINSVIGVGDDCISIGDDSCDITVHNVTCGPGHGISIGSLGRYPNEKDVRNVAVSNVTFLNTTNGARIKTMHESPVLAATNISFTDVIVQHTYNPIIIDQHYFANKPGPSKVKISGVSFKNFKGSSLSNVAINLNCSDAVPCEGIELTDIDFIYTGNCTANTSLFSECWHAKATFNGKMNPPGCPPGP